MNCEVVKVNYMYSLARFFLAVGQTETGLGICLTRGLH